MLVLPGDTPNKTLVAAPAIAAPSLPNTDTLERYKLVNLFTPAWSATL